MLDGREEERSVDFAPSETEEEWRDNGEERREKELSFLIQHAWTESSKFDAPSKLVNCGEEIRKG